MRVLVFDTETSGLPPKNSFNRVSLVNIHAWPHIVQFSYVVYDTKTNDIENIVDVLIKIPQEVVLDEQNTRIHGITNADCAARGHNIGDVLVKFVNDCENVDCIVGHNLSFDINMVKAEWYRIIENKKISHKYTRVYAAYTSFLARVQQVCTMMLNIDRCGIKAVSAKGKEYMKYPTLAELHTTLYGDAPSGLHNALVDVVVCLRCFCKTKLDIELSNKCHAVNEILGL